MLRLRLEMVPHGNERRVREVGRLEIWNVSELAEISNYEYRMRADDGRWRVGYVLQHLRSKGAWELVRRALIDQLKREPDIGKTEAAPEKAQG